MSRVKIDVRCWAFNSPVEQDRVPFTERKVICLSCVHISEQTSISVWTETHSLRFKGTEAENKGKKNCDI